jgi:hypothetical protein
MSRQSLTLKNQIVYLLIYSKNKNKMFVEKTIEEVSAMSMTEQATYLTEKKAHELNVRKAEIEAAIADAKKETSSELEVLKAELNNVVVDLKGLKEAPAKVEGSKTIGQALAVALKAAEGDIQKAINGKQETAIKVAVTMSVDDTIGAGPTQVTITDNTGIISPIRKRELRYLANVSVGSTIGNRALWIEELDEQGNPIMLAEGAEKPQASVRYEERTANVKKIAVYGKVTTEMMADLPQLISYIQNNLMKRLDIVLEDNFFNGDNLGDNLNGAFNLATPWAAGVLAGTIVSPSDYDVVESVALQTELAFGMPTAIFVNPAVVARMRLTKDSVGQYVLPVFATANGLEVSGMRVIPTTAVTGENFIGGDMSILHVLVREELGIQIGLDGNDFINNKKTMLLEKRIVQFASANDVGCLIKGEFDVAKAALAV